VGGVRWGAVCAELEMPTLPLDKQLESVTLAHDDGIVEQPLVVAVRGSRTGRTAVLERVWDIDAQDMALYRGPQAGLRSRWLTLRLSGESAEPLAVRAALLTVGDAK